MADVYAGMIAGRHPLPVDLFIFDEEIADIKDIDSINQHMSWWLLSHVENGDTLHVYVTGLSMVLASLIWWCQYLRIPLELLHYDQQAADGSYFPQMMYVCK